MQTIPFTKVGYENLKKEQQELLVKRKETVDHLRKAREMGDLSENGYYKAAKFELGNIDRRLRKLEEYIRYGKIIEVSTKNVVDIGCTVTLSVGKAEKTYAIVGKHESNPLEGKLSYASPLGRALMDKKAGDTVVVYAPQGKVEYKILAIS